MAILLREAESRGIILHEAFALADTEYWLQHIDWQTKFLEVVLAFAWQAGGGLIYEVTDRLTLNVGYRYFQGRITTSTTQIRLH